MRRSGVIDSLAVEGDRRILLVVLDGLGGIPLNGKTELETASVPNLDSLAARSSLGLLTPVEPGVTPGSGPAHLALFGYDPVVHLVGRGVMEALGVDLEIGAGDLCARANFATVDDKGRVVDRRAQRIDTESSTALCDRLQRAAGNIDGVEVIVRPGREHRFVVVFRGEGLSEGLTDSDPLHTGAAALPVRPMSAAAERAAAIANKFIQLSADVLASEPVANSVLLRGLSCRPVLMTLAQRFRLRAACVAVYPMYRGLARLVGMDVVEAGEIWADEVEAVRAAFVSHDYVYMHIKEPDKAGEDGSFAAKVEVLERFDEQVLPGLLDSGADAICITGDHSTPATMGGHSWHAVPVLLHSEFVRPSSPAEGFGERACLHGSLGCLPAHRLMGLLLAHALRLRKFGA